MPEKATFVEHTLFLMKKYFALICSTLFFMNVNAQEKHVNLLIGTYTNSCESKGIYSYDFNTETADFQLKNSTENVVNPSYLTISNDEKFIYSINENGKDSNITAFHYNAKTGKLDFINKQSSEGADPCFIMNDDKNVLVANYSGGTISVFKKNKKGGINPAAQVIKHEGKSTNEKRQESPHVHMVQFSPDKKFVLANDLGTDRIYIYKYNANSDKEILTFKDSVPIKTASGPRHLTFSNDGKFVYLLQELDGTLTVFAYADGKMNKIQETSVVAKDFAGENSAADIHISADGKFLYATNRGEANTISTFVIDSKGKLTHKNTISTGGKGPRNFTIDPTGKFVLIAHQYSNDVIVFSRNAATGELVNTGKKLELCSPVCLVFN